MKTLYDLLGALPDDDAEALRTAFRKAAKGAHPDLNPGDPDAALKFRQIVRAHDILADDEQRAVYDHLLDLADAEHEEAARRAAALTIRKISSATMALAGLLLAAGGGYLLLLQTSAASIATATEAEDASGPPAIAAAAPEQPRPGDALDRTLRFDPRHAFAYLNYNAMQEFDRPLPKTAPRQPVTTEGRVTPAPKAATRPQVEPRATSALPRKRQMAEEDPSRFPFVSDGLAPR